MNYYLLVVVRLGPEYLFVKAEQINYLAGNKIPSSGSDLKYNYIVLAGTSNTVSKVAPPEVSTVVRGY
jgi:hypothetical protein